MKNFKAQLQNIFNLQTVTEIYQHLDSIWSLTFKIVATILITYAVIFICGFLHMLENSNPTIFPEFYNNLLEVARSILALMVVFLALKSGFYLLLRRKQEQGTCMEQVKSSAHKS